MDGLSNQEILQKTRINCTDNLWRRGEELTKMEKFKIAGSNYVPYTGYNKGC